eukprot:365421-Chlamydomonas_euryale.AAC.1
MQQFHEYSVTLLKHHTCAVTQRRRARASMQLSPCNNSHAQDITLHIHQACAVMQSAAHALPCTRAHVTVPRAGCNSPHTPCMRCHAKQRACGPMYLGPCNRSMLQLAAIVAMASPALITQCRPM